MVAKRKNTTMMIMVYYMLYAIKVHVSFQVKVVNLTFYLLNHCPKQGKLDKSFPYIMSGVSDESKGYNYFDP